MGSGGGKTDKYMANYSAKLMSEYTDKFMAKYMGQFKAILSLSLLISTAICPCTVGFASSGGSAMSEFASAADKRAATSMGESIAASNLITIGQMDEHFALKVTEVLKGDKTQVGKTLSIGPRRSCDAYPTKGNPVAVFWGKDGATTSIVDTLSGDQNLAALRCLVKVYAIGDEHARFTKLSGLFVDPSNGCPEAKHLDLASIFKREFYGALPTMRDPKTFEIVKNLYPKVAPDEQLKLLTWMADTRDARAVPLLLDALQSKDKFIKSEAQNKLSYSWSKRPDVKAALQKLHAAGVASGSSAGSATSSSNGSAASTQTAFQKAETFSKAGQTAAAREQYFAALEHANAGESKDVTAYTQRAAAQKLLVAASAQDKKRIWQAIAPQIYKDAKSGNYLESAEAAEIMLKLRDPACLDDLILLLDRRDVMQAKANRLATMAVIDLGPAARAKVAQHLLSLVQSGGALVKDQESRTTTLVELVFIGTEADSKRCTELVASKPDFKFIWDKLAKLQGVSDKKEQCQYLSNLMQSKSELLPDVLPWVAERLGRIGDGAASSVLVAALGSVNYHLSDCAASALISLGRKCSKDKLVAAALIDGDNRARSIDVLCTIYGAEALPTIRKIAKDPKAKYKASAFIWLGRLGNKDDLTYLIPMSDYWQGDRLNHYWVTMALDDIESRR
ncbi:MAG: hypothetical protein QG625_3027 [Cyanobacteriota bacterium erpe_2018_sw_39hr_WHONDRS-SW48-000098_B_bin.30]|nr:hypothetical protein [Cyanobacteriota bacterium erpe_2018_sw_39hr_WHONDRS-SW48-000098_B_bin.30]